MSFRGFLIRLDFVAVATWLLVGFTESLGWTLTIALMPIAYFEMLRPR